MSNEVVRSVCYFTDNPNQQTVDKVNELEAKLVEKGYEVQTKRVCTPIADPIELQERVGDKTWLLCVGTLPFEQAVASLPKFYQADGVSFNVDLTSIPIDIPHTAPLFKIIKNRPGVTFNFTYVFNNKPSSPYFPSANYARNGFSIGLQPTDLAEDCSTLEEWLEKMKASWLRLDEMLGSDPDFLGIDSSIAPIFEGKGSLINFIRRLEMSFSGSVTTNTYVRITQFMKEQNPKPVGLCGLMMPCLEDFELADEYEGGNFSIERNVFLSLHSGLGIDTYPIGIDEDPKRVVEILRLVQALSQKYTKPLSVRFVSDGKAEIGQRTDFQNQYLKDVIVRPL
ncbi:DUF711 family protein [Candidatus Daviesbacteria bacterium]|nr:DUF711 family protein [Candidatus Daviesbacteria bacterium]